MKLAVPLTSLLVMTSVGLLSGQQASAQPPLSGSGMHLTNVPFFSQADRPCSIAPTYSGSSPFLGSWSSAAPEPWVGSYTAAGPAIWSGGTAGTTTFDFSGLPGGSLPANTLFTFVDFDGSAEQITLVPPPGITSPWLSEPIAVFVDPADPTGTAPVIAMPGWSLVGGIYTIDGSTITTAYNPSIGFTLRSLVPLSGLTITKPNATNFSIDAPCEVAGVVQVPTLSVSGMLVLGLLLMGTGYLLIGMRRRTGA